MKRLIAVVMCVVCMAPAVFAAGPVETSAASALTQQVQDTNKPKMERKNPELYWGGIAMAGIGGWVLGWGLGTPQKSVTCFGGFSVVSCAESGGNRGMLIGVGAAVMSAGVVMGAIGGKKVAVSPTLGGFRVSSTASF